MCIRDFARAIDESDVRLKEPHLAAFVIPTPAGPVMPIIGRHKNIKDNSGKVIGTELWYDLPGGKADPIKERGLIVDVESGDKAAKRETYEETGTFIEITDELDSDMHPAKPGLKRHFYAAAFLGGKFENKVPDEHLFAIMVPVEQAIVLLGERITDKVRDYIRSEAARMEAEIAPINPVFAVA